MRARIIIIVLVIVSIFLGVALIKVSKNVEIRTVENTKVVTQVSNEISKVSGDLDEQRQVNSLLTNMVEREKKNVTELTQEKAQLKGDLQRVTGERDEAKSEVERVKLAAAEAAKVAQQEIERHVAKIAQLEKEQETLVKTMDGLTNQIALLAVKISETEKKLASAEGQNDFLLKELNRLRAEKAELERQFNDLKIVKEQTKKLTEEHHVALRLEWMRKGLYQDLKGAEMLSRPRTKPATPATNYNLDVELRRDGAPVIKAATNAPAVNK
jgi:chromosome segregation ATPase